MSEDVSKKEDKNQTQKVEKRLVISYEVEPTSRREKAKLFGNFLYWFFIALALVAIVFIVLLFVLGIFPTYIPISTANELLNTLISVDGILVGFVGIIFAQLLSSLMDQQNVCINGYLRSLRKPLKT